MKYKSLSCQQMGGKEEHFQFLLRRQGAKPSEVRERSVERKNEMTEWRDKCREIEVTLFNLLPPFHGLGFLSLSVCLGFAIRWFPVLVGTFSLCQFIQ